MQRLARTCYRHRRLVLAGWVALLVGLIVLSNVAGGVFKVEFRLPGSESQRAFDLLQKNGFANRTGDQGQIVFETTGKVDDPAVKAAMQKLFADVRAQVKNVEIVSPYDPNGASQISTRGDHAGKIAYAEINFADRTSAEYTDDAAVITGLRDQVNVPGLRIELGDEIFAENPFGSTEAIGLLLAVIILIVAFGSLLAMGLPIATALFGIGCGVAIVKLVANVMNMPDFTTQAVLMIAIGVGIDYALFVVTRYREALHDGDGPEQAIVRSLDTAGRAVLFAGTTVIIALLGLLILNSQTFRGVAAGTAIGVLVTMIASVTLLPALLGFVGTNIDRFAVGRKAKRQRVGVGMGSRTGFWYRWSRFIQRRPWPAFVAALIILIALTLPVFGLRLGFGDAGNRPTSDTTRQAYDLLSEGFGPGFNGTLLVAAETPKPPQVKAMRELATSLESVPGIAFVSPVKQNETKTAAIFQIVPTTSPQDRATTDLVKNLRKFLIPEFTRGQRLDVAVGGLPAAVNDFSAYTSRMLPVVVALVLALSFILLMTVFRSLLVPLKAVIMNLLSVGVAYGMMVAVFQKGFGADLLGVGKEGPIEAWAPLMQFAVVFGLSMDYEVFLLTRIKEEYDRTHDNATAVADGLAATARVITAAAAIMVCVFGAFVLGSERSLQLFGFGLAVAVLVDATIVRMVLVPATMELLGDRNWWMPKWLDRLLPVLHVEGSRDRAQPDVAPVS